MNLNSVERNGIIKEQDFFKELNIPPTNKHSNINLNPNLKLNLNPDLTNQANSNIPSTSKNIPNDLPNINKYKISSNNLINSTPKSNSNNLDSSISNTKKLKRNPSSIIGNANSTNSKYFSILMQQNPKLFKINSLSNLGSLISNSSNNGIGFNNNKLSYSGSTKNVKKM